MELKNKKRNGFSFKKMCQNAFAAATGTYLSVMSTMMFASAKGDGDWGNGITVSNASASKESVDTLMNNVIGILLTIARYAGIALLVYGIYEVVMSFMQQQPEAKTKGIIMAICGVVLIALKTLVNVVVPGLAS